MCLVARTAPGLTLTQRRNRPFLFVLSHYVYGGIDIGVTDVATLDTPKRRLTLAVFRSDVTTFCATQRRVCRVDREHRRVFFGVPGFIPKLI